MKLRRFFGTLMIVALSTLGLSMASATTRIAAGGIDKVVLGSGRNALIISGTVTGQTRTSVTFPNSNRSLAAIEYTIVGKVIKGNSLYQVGDQEQTVKVKMYAGEMKDFPRPVIGQEGMHIFYGNSQVGLTSYAFGPEGQIPYKEVQGKKIAVSPYGKGLVFADKNLAAKFLKANPAASKMLRTGPALPGEAIDQGEEELTPELLESAVKSILQSEGE